MQPCILFDRLSILFSFDSCSSVTLLFVACCQDWMSGAMFGSASDAGDTASATTGSASNSAYLLTVTVLIIAALVIGGGLGLFGFGISAAAPQSLAGPLRVTAVRWQNEDWSRPVLPDHAELAVLEQGQHEVIGDGLISSSLAGPARVTAVRWPNKAWSRPVLPDHAELAAWDQAQLAAARARRGWRPIIRVLTSHFNKRTHRRRPGDISPAPDGGLLAPSQTTPSRQSIVGLIFPQRNASADRQQQAYIFALPNLRDGMRNDQDAAAGPAAERAFDAHPLHHDERRCIFGCLSNFDANIETNQKGTLHFHAVFYLYMLTEPHGRPRAPRSLIAGPHARRRALMPAGGPSPAVHHKLSEPTAQIQPAGRPPGRPQFSFSAHNKTLQLDCLYVCE